MSTTTVTTPSATPLAGTSLTFVGLELCRIGRNLVAMFFTAVLPAFLYVIFGAVQSYGDESVGNGNVRMWVMIAMAAYGAVTATVSIGGEAAVERMQGWGRQLGLTPLSDAGFVAMKAVVAIVIAAIPVTLIYLLGWFTGAEGSTGAWVGSALLILAGSAVFSLWGLVFGLAVPSEAAISAAGGSLVILGFLGNIFFPLSGLMLTIGKFTPLYGYAALARYPLTEGGVIDGTTGEVIDEPLWIPLLNVGVWAVLLAALAVYFVRRGRARQ